MKTWLISHAEGCALDSDVARITQFRHLQEFSGDEWTFDLRKQVAPRYAWGDGGENERFYVTYDERAQGACESYVVDEFPTLEKANDFAEA